MMHGLLSSLDRYIHSTTRYYTVEPLIMETLKSGQPPYNGQNCLPLCLYIYCPYISTFKGVTTSEQWTKHSSPKCPLFGGSTVHLRLQVSARVIHYFQKFKIVFRHYTSVYVKLCNTCAAVSAEDRKM